MKEYLRVMNRILADGEQQPNRTGVDTLFVPGDMMKFDQRDGTIAMITTKRVPFKPIVGEAIGFCRGVDNAADFRKLGAKIWDSNANKDGVAMDGRVVPNPWLTNRNRKGEDDLGRIYGVQWRGWRGRPSITGTELTGVSDGKLNGLAAVEYSQVDQLWNAIQQIKTNPTNRRIIVNAWRPDEFELMALPPCHVMFQFLVNVAKKELHLCMYQRSCDWPLGIPFNITSYSLILWMVAKATGYIPATFTHFVADAHIYLNQVELAKEQVTRSVRVQPKLVYTGEPLDLCCEQYGPAMFDHVDPAAFYLDGYDPHPEIAYPFNI